MPSAHISAGGIAPPSTTSGLERPWERLDLALAAAIAPDLPAIASEIIEEIGRVVPDYRRPLEGVFGHNLQAGVQEGLSQFLELIGHPGRQALAHRDVYAGLGRGELAAGRGLDALQSAYRVGARVAWRRMSAAARAAGADAATVSLLAESMFDYIDEISAESVEGYAQAQAQVAGEQQRLRQRLVRLLVGDDPPDAGALTAAAAAAAWALPRVLAVICTREQDVSRVSARLGAEAIGGRVGELTCALVPDPAAPGRREQLSQALGRHTATLGPPAPLADARRSFALARDALVLVEADLLPSGRLLAVEEHLVAVLLAREPSLTEELARRRLSPLLALGPGPRGRMQDHGNGGHLRDHLGLAKIAGLDGVAFGRRDTAEPGDRELAPDDQHHHPRRNSPDLDERNKCGGNQEFIGDGIEQCADCGDLLPAPCQIAVQQIGSGGDQEDCERQKCVWD